MQRYNNEYDAKEELAALPQDYTVVMALEYKDILRTPWGKAYHINRLRQFIHNVDNGIPDKVRITTFGIDGPPSVSILEYNGKNIKYIIDSTRTGGPTAIYVYDGPDLYEGLERNRYGRLAYILYLNSYQRDAYPVFQYVLDFQ